LFLLGIVFGLGTFVLMFFGQRATDLHTWLAQSADWIPPVGWILSALGASRRVGHGPELWSCVASGVILALAPLAYRHLRRSYALGEQEFAAARGVAPGGSLAGHPEVAAQFEVEPEAVRAAVRATPFQAGVDWPSLGIVEGWAARLLTEREKQVAEFLTAGHPGWTRSLRTLLILLVILAAALGPFSAQLKDFPFVGFIVVYLLFAGFLGNWRGTASPQGAGHQSAFYAVYPVSLGEIWRTMLKINFFRYCCAFPFLAVVVLLLTWKSAAASETTRWMGLKLVLLGLLLQPVLPVFAISPGTNDTQRAGRVGLLVVMGLVTVGAAIGFVASWDLRVVAGCGAATLFCSALSAWQYIRLYNRNRFDLMPMTKPTHPLEG
jgi:hypothetical protein